jgi:hypothetical protein
MVGHGGVAVAFILAPFGGPGAIHTHLYRSTLEALQHLGRKITTLVYFPMAEYFNYNRLCRLSN